MGMQDRDYYREHHAEKNGMRYNSKNATYSSAEKLFKDAVRPSVRIPKMHPVLLVLLTFFICLSVFSVLKLVTKLI